MNNLDIEPKQTFEHSFRAFAKIYNNPFLTLDQNNKLMEISRDNRMLLSQSDYWLMQAKIIGEDLSLTQTGTLFTKEM